ncbi:MAG: hypothetical protein QOE69_177, partial [Thermoleophilaceae bacterium]|nr:hypothetical protein [Thermoleophilaceae bacterium]
FGTWIFAIRDLYCFRLLATASNM